MGRVNDGRKTHLILGGVMAGVVLIFVIIIAVMLTGGEDQPQKKYNRFVTKPKETKQAPRYPSNYKLPEAKVQKPGTRVQPLIPREPARRPEVRKPAAATAPAVEQAKPLPAAMVQKVRDDVLALPEFYLRKILPGAMKSRLTALLAAGKGTAQDRGFLEGISGDPRVYAAREEMRKIEQQHARFSREAVATLPMDIVTLKDGRKLEGNIKEASASQVRLERKLSSGVGGVMTFPRSQVKEVGKGRGPGGEFQKRWEAAKAGPVDKLESLMSWCRSENLQAQADLACYSILKLDPGHVPARTAAKLPADPFQVAAAPVAGPGGASTGTTIMYDGKPWAPFDLKEKLLNSGYALINGKWYRGEKKLIIVPSLYKYFDRGSQPVQFSSTTAPLITLTDRTYSPKARTTGQAAVVGGYASYPIQVDMGMREKELQRFYSTPLTVTPATAFPAQGGAGKVKIWKAIDDIKPRPGFTQTGELAISVQVDAPLLEASVSMTAEVRGGGSIIVYLKKGPARVKLQEITGTTRRSIEIPSEHIAGTRQLNLVAVIRQQSAYKKSSRKHTLMSGGFVKARGVKVRRLGVELEHTQFEPEYQVKLFPCTRNTSQVFRLSATVGEPVDRLDALFKDFPKVLR